MRYSERQNIENKNNQSDESFVVIDNDLNGYAKKRKELNATQTNIEYTYEEIKKGDHLKEICNKYIFPQFYNNINIWFGLFINFCKSVY